MATARRRTERFFGDIGKADAPQSNNPTLALIRYSDGAVILSDQLVTALAAAAFPTFAVLIDILINNQRLNDMNQRLGDMNMRLNDFGRAVDIRFTDTNRHIDDVKEVLRGEMFRIEQVIDARLKHLEEHLPR
jgi:hypothetical protein